MHKVSRDSLFYDQYEYCLNFKLSALSVMRDLDHQCIDRVLNHRAQWLTNKNFGGSWRSHNPITDEMRANCHALCDFLLSQKNYKLVISQDWGYIYSSNMAMLKDLENLSYIQAISVKQAMVDRPRGTLVIKSSKHEFRSYFRARRITAELKKNLHDFLSGQDDIRIGPGLADSISDSNRYCYINDNCFIDHNGQGIVVMLNLILPRAIRKTVQLLTHK